MTITRLNDAPVLDQVQEHWQKLMALVLWKYHKGETVKLTVADMQEYGLAFERGEAMLFTHGHHDSIELSIITKARAQALAEHAQTQRGTA